MSKGWKIALTIAGLILIPGSIYAGIGIYMLMKIDYSMGGYKIKSFDHQFLYIDIAIKVTNPSVLGVTMAGYNLLFYLNDVLVADMKNNIPKVIESKKGVMLTLPLKINFRSMEKKKAAEILGYLFTAQWDKIVLKVGGKFNAVLLKIPIAYKLEPKKWTYTLEDIIKIMQEPSTPVTTPTV